MTTPHPVPPAIRLGGWLMILLGAALALSVLPGADALLRLLLDLVFWPLDGTDHMAAPATRLMTAIAGGVIVGWGVTLLGLGRAAAPLAPDAAWRPVMAGYLAWFTVDGIGSVAAGAPFNLIGNAIFLACIALPLLRAARAG